MKKYFAITIIILIITTLLYNYADKKIALYFYSIPSDSIFREFFHFITRFGKSEWYLTPSFLLYLYFRKRENREYAKMSLYIFITNVVAGIGVWFIKVPFGRARPKLYILDNIYGFKWFEFHHSLTSFPSGHTITAISSAFALGFLFPRYKYLFLIFGIVVAFSRVVGVNHYMSDIVFSSFLGYFIALIIYKKYYLQKDFR